MRKNLFSVNLPKKSSLPKKSILAGFPKKSNSVEVPKKSIPASLAKSLFSASIGKRITFLIGFIIAVLLFLLIFFVKQSYDYNNQYVQILDNLVKINYITGKTEKQPKTVGNMCAFGGNIADSGEVEVVEQLKPYVESIRENIGSDPIYKQNQTMLDSVDQYVTNYVSNFEQLVKVCGDNYTSAGGEYAQKMQAEAGFIKSYATSLMQLELDRSNQLEDKISRSFQKLIMAAIFIVSAVIIIVIAMTMVIIRRTIIKPIGLLKNNIAIMADGDLTGEEIVLNTKDELKDLAVAFNVMSANLKSIISQVHCLSIEVGDAIETVTVSADENASGSAAITRSVEGISERIIIEQDESNHIERELEDLMQISESINEKIQRISNNADTSLQNAISGNDAMSIYMSQLEGLNVVMNEVAGIAGELSISANEMNHILNSITEIASQTNLLSLNASIEAARAGEAGRGFAVVATEIRNLAENSSQSAKQIGNIIKRVQDYAVHMSKKMEEGMDQMTKGNELANSTQNRFSEIKVGTKVVDEDIRSMMEDLQALSKITVKVSSNVESINKTIGDNVNEMNVISSNVSEQAVNLEEVSAASKKISEQVADLRSLVSEFKI